MKTAYFKPSRFILALGFSLYSLAASAEIIDPEQFIERRGPQSSQLGDDGMTRFFSYTERTDKARIKILEKAIEALPKRQDVLKACDFTCGTVKAKLIEQRGQAIDVAVTNYGHRGSTIACVLKYMFKAEVGTQLMYMKKGKSGMYMVFVTD